MENENIYFKYQLSSNNQNNLVDLNDLQIHMNPMLQLAFQKPLNIKKIPYGLLLNSLPQMFI